MDYRYGTDFDPVVLCEAHGVSFHFNALSRAAHEWRYHSEAFPCDYPGR